MPLIRRYSASNRFRPSFVSPEEFQSDLIICITDGLHGFEQRHNASSCPFCDLRGCATWIGWRARLTRTRLIRSQRKRLIEDTVDVAHELPCNGTSLFVKARVLEALRKANKEEYEAAISVLEGYTGDEVKHSLGVTVAGRNYRLRKLGVRLLGLSA